LVGVLALLSVIAAAALAATTPAPPDTQYSPQPTPADQAKQWSWQGGAHFGTLKTPANSPTPVEADLFAVRFWNPTNGYAGGAICKDPAPAGTGDVQSYLDNCLRVPVIYRYTELPGQAGQWTEVYRGTTKGYVAAISFISRDRVLAVGGGASPGGPGTDGAYPRRESPVAVNDPGYLDPAGRARWWVIDQSQVPDSKPHEVTDPGLKTSDGRPAGGLTALDCTPRASFDGEFCVAGGVQQLWMWHDGRFDRAYTRESPASDFDMARDPSDPTGKEGDFRFRVRAIRFLPGADPPTSVTATAQQPAAQVVATTGGCCATLPNENNARALYWDGVRWNSRLLINDPHGDFSNSSGLGDSAGAVAPQRYTTPQQTLADSYYGLEISTPNGAAAPHMSVLATQGKPQDPAAPDRPSAVLANIPLPDQEQNNALYEGINLTFTAAGSTASSNQYDYTGDIFREAINPQTTALRFTSGDGDLASPPPRSAQSAGGVQVNLYPQGPDGLMDWVVGSETSTRQAVAFTTLERPPAPSAVSCPGDPGGQPSPSCQPKNSSSLTSQSHSGGLYALDSYPLNGFQLVGDSGIGWAVGDNGALERLGGAGTVGSATPDPNPPALGAPASSALPDTSAYDAFRSTLSSDPGTVPALASQPLDRLGSPGFLAAGSPEPNRPSSSPNEDLSSMVMSRDGSEGWAVGADRLPSEGAAAGMTTTLFHFNGSSWQRCDSEGIAGVLPADPACASIQALRVYRDQTSGQTHPVQLTAIARVPLEVDDPSRAADFELVAVGAAYRVHPRDPYVHVVLRYRHGVWSVDSQSMSEIGLVDGFDLQDLVFTSPRDGWLTAKQSAANANLRLWHYDGQHWIDCSKSPGGCDDPHSLLPLDGLDPATDGALHLTSVGSRTYLAATRTDAGASNGIIVSAGARYPVIFYHDAGSPDGWKAQYDPGKDPTQKTPANQGCINSIAVVKQSDRFHGWATGNFGAGAACVSDSITNTSAQSSTTLLSLNQVGAKDDLWKPWTADDASTDYGPQAGPPTGHVPFLGAATGAQPRVFSFTGAGDQRTVSVLADPFNGGFPRYALLGFAIGGRPNWEVISTPFSGLSVPGNHNLHTLANVRAMASDGQGGFWLAAHQVGEFGASAVHQSVHFYHYTDRVPRPVFSDVAHPVRQQVTGAAAGPDGSVWLSTASSTLYRYDRFTGWDTVVVSGWDPGLVTKASHANAVAVGPDGRGVVVGEGGRIGDVAPGVAVLDAAAGVTGSACGPAPGPCGTSRTLRAAAVAPDGSALVGGDARTVLWRAAGGAFRPVTKPLTSQSATITGVALPSPDRAWLTTDTGQVFVGQRQGADWSWQVEDLNSSGDVMALDYGRRTRALRAIAVDASGHGFAVGDRGIVLERIGSGSEAWRRMATGSLDDMTSVTLNSSGRRGALIGASDGLILTLQAGHWQVAHEGDHFSGMGASWGRSSAPRVVGLALLAGHSAGQVEAWAAYQQPGGDTYSRNPPPTQLLHYSSDPTDPSLSPAGRAVALPDRSAPRPGELSFAAFGKSDCQDATTSVCPELTGTNLFNEIVQRRTVDAISAQAKSPGGPAFSLFTGDANSAGGTATGTGTPTDKSVVHRRWVEGVANRFLDAGVPLFGAIGGQDLSHVSACDPVGFGACGSSRSSQVGSNQAWRQALAGMPSPWGTTTSAQPLSSQGLSFTRVTVPGSAPSDAPGGGAATHYAVDVSRGSTAVARLVFVDTSLKSLSAGESSQQPLESQTRWLTDVLCFKGQGTAGQACTRDLSQQAVVVSNTPTYSYGPGSTSDVQTDAASFESVLFQYKASVVVSGRLGWNALYWATAPGLHSPCAGDGYPDPSQPPQAGARPSCGAASGVPTTPDAASQLAGSLSSTAAPAAPAGCSGAGGNGAGILPTVVASSAGGKFGPDGQAAGTADTQGFWHGYTVVRLDKSGDPRCTIIEQRPILDWVGINAQTHVLKPGQHVTLKGYGREPVGADIPIVYDQLNGPAITHRYDLLKADPTRPYLPATSCPRATDNPAGYC